MENVSIVEKTKDYVTVRISRRLAGKLGIDGQLTESEALKILKKGLLEVRRGKTKKLNSLKELR
jgi:hypothetical protein